MSACEIVLRRRFPRCFPGSPRSFEHEGKGFFLVGRVVRVRIASGSWLFYLKRHRAEAQPVPNLCRGLRYSFVVHECTVQTIFVFYLQTALGMNEETGMMTRDLRDG